MHVSLHLCHYVFVDPCCYACFCCMFVFLFVCVRVCVGQGSRNAAVCRPAMPVYGGTADDTTAADGGGPEVAGAGGETAGNTHRVHTLEKTHIQT